MSISLTPFPPHPSLSFLSTNLWWAIFLSLAVPCYDTDIISFFNVHRVLFFILLIPSTTTPIFSFSIFWYIIFKSRCLFPLSNFKSIPAFVLSIHFFLFNKSEAQGSLKLNSSDVVSIDTKRGYGALLLVLFVFRLFLDNTLNLKVGALNKKNNDKRSNPKHHFFT